MKNVAKWVSMPHAWNQVSNVTVIEGRVTRGRFFCHGLLLCLEIAIAPIPRDKMPSLCHTSNSELMSSTDIAVVGSLHSILYIKSLT